jgi:hypothetical protein
MRVFFSTVVRGAPVQQAGEIVQLDWERKVVTARAKIYPTNPELDDPNPRGNTRGGRGIAFFNRHILVCSYHTVCLFDPALTPIRDISNSLMVGLHEIYHPENSDRLWVTATAIDAVLEIDIETGETTRQFWPRERAGFQNELGLTPLEIDKDADNRGRFLSRHHLEHPHHLHLNAVCDWRGELHGLFNAFGAVVNLERESVLIREAALRGAHNLIIREDGVTFINDTLGHSIRIYDLADGALVKSIDLTQFDWVRALVAGDPTSSGLVRGLARYPRISQPIHRILTGLNLMPSLPAWSLFVRGLALVGDSLFVGISPASILQIDWQSDKLVDAYTYSQDKHVSIHGLRVATG